MGSTLTFFNSNSYVFPIRPYAYSPCDRCDQLLCYGRLLWNVGNFPSFASYHDVTRLQKPILKIIRWRYFSACISNGGRTPWWVPHPWRFQCSHVNWLTRFYTISNLFSNKLLTAADEEFLQHVMTSPTRCRTGRFPSTLDHIFLKYSSSILSINHLAPSSKSGHATPQVNRVVS